ncbi:MAG: GIY-YIG nuclease family protein [Thalassotalea sp.]|nr:GIY-YIG nuclease family protein [Thalassotalea sp.]
MQQPCIYILTNKKNGTLYIGVTSNLPQRIEQHRSKLVVGFTAKYDLHVLVYFESYPTITEAIIREKRLKKWNRQWKINLIEKLNPKWEDISYLLA